jgi:hypothetical protein
MALAFLAIAGAGLSFAGLFVEPDRGWANLLGMGVYLLGLGLGGTAIVALFYVTGAAWGTALRRVPEAMGALVIVGGLILLAVLFLHPSLYPWFGLTAQGGSELSPFQTVWFDRPFFLTRSIGYIVVWIGFAVAIARNSRTQDESGNPSLTTRNTRLSALFLVVFAVTCWLASTDWIMSLEPKWSSTIFGVYQFAGIFLSSLAAMAAIAIRLYWQGGFRTALTRNRLHDLGTLLFGFSCFWMYIWFCQYLLIWYVNNPEETSYFSARQRGDWQTLFWLNLVLNWGIPFVVLLFRSAKQTPWVLFVVAIMVLAGRWLDLYVMILPPVVGTAADPGVWELGPALLGLGVGLLTVRWGLSRTALVPLHDPLLEETGPEAGRVSERVPG